MENELKILLDQINAVADKLELSGDQTGASEFLNAIATDAAQRKAVLDLWRVPSSVNV